MPAGLSNGGKPTIWDRDALAKATSLSDLSAYKIKKFKKENNPKIRQLELKAEREEFENTFPEIIESIMGLQKKFKKVNKRLKKLGAKLK